MERFICLLIGYAFGLVQTGYIYGKMKGVDIRKEGSGNAGSTNALRTMGIKAGLITLLGDCFKCVFAVVTVYLIYGKTYADIFPLLAMYAGMGAVLGHNYPFYLNFKGGKGIAATAGLILSTTNVWMVLICLFAFLGIVAVTRYVSLGSLVVVTLFLIGMVFFGSHGAYGLGNRYLMEFYLVSAAVTLMAFWRHRSNISRLLHGTENKIGSKKK